MYRYISSVESVEGLSMTWTSVILIVVVIFDIQYIGKLAKVVDAAHVSTEGRSVPFPADTAGRIQWISDLN